MFRVIQVQLEVLVVLVWMDVMEQEDRKESLVFLGNKASMENRLVFSCTITTIYSILVKMGFV